MFKTKFSNKTKSIATLVAFGLIAIVLVAFGIKINAQNKTVSLDGLSYAVGTINSTNGKINESNYSLYSKKLGKVDGLEIKLKDNASITYKVAFYDEDKEFISISTAQSDDFDNSDIANSAVYFRVVITPNEVDEEPVKVTVLNMFKYANMLTVTYNK